MFLADGPEPPGLKMVSRIIIDMRFFLPVQGAGPLESRNSLDIDFRSIMLARLCSALFSSVSSPSKISLIMSFFLKRMALLSFAIM